MSDSESSATFNIYFTIFQQNLQETKKKVTFLAMNCDGFLLLGYLWQPSHKMPFLSYFESQYIFQCINYIQCTCIQCFLYSFFLSVSCLLKNILLFYILHAPFSWKKSPGKQISMAAILPRLNVKTLSLVPIRMTA